MFRAYGLRRLADLRRCTLPQMVVAAARQAARSLDLGWQRYCVDPEMPFVEETGDSASHSPRGAPRVFFCSSQIIGKMYYPICFAVTAVVVAALK